MIFLQIKLYFSVFDCKVICVIMLWQSMMHKKKSIQLFNLFLIYVLSCIVFSIIFQFIQRFGIKDIQIQLSSFPSKTDRYNNGVMEKCTK